MKATLLLVLLLLSSVFAENSNSKISEKRQAKLIQKGERVSNKLCDEKKLSKITTKTFEEVSKEIDEVKPCIALNKRNKEALIYFLLSQDKNTTSKKEESINLPKDSKCPVCGMIINKYPKWVALMEIGDTKHYFDGVKDMMKFYIFDADFPYDRSKIEEIKVTDFYTLKGINAKKAFYVIGSDIYGPMGEELVPFETEKEAQNFMKDHKGKKIIKFQDITPKIVMALDGIEYNE